MTEGKLRVGWGIIGSHIKGLRVEQMKRLDHTRESSTFS
jgi:hypothetical protein